MSRSTRSIFVLLVIILVAGLGGCMGVKDEVGCCGKVCPIQDGAVVYTNPVWTGYLADPHMIKVGEMYYAYGTHDNGARGDGIERVDMKGRQFVVVRSKDMVNWECMGGALESYKGGEKEAYWAPEVAAANGKFYMYYSASMDGQGEKQRLRVAIADKPEGPFKDCGKLLFPDLGFTIDAHPFKDPKTDQWYLYFSKDTLSGHVGTGNWVVKLADDMVNVVGEPVKAVLPSAEWQIFEKNRLMYGKRYDWHTVEGAHVIYKDGQYIMFYSGGRWENESYGLAYAVADNPMGPWTDYGTEQGASVLKSCPGVNGPGHNSVIMAPDGKTWLCVYHAWDDGWKARQLCIDPIEWTDKGPHVSPSRKEMNLPVCEKKVY